MHVMDILEHGKCLVLLFAHKYINYNENLWIGNNLFLCYQFTKIWKGPFKYPPVLWNKTWFYTEFMRCTLVNMKLRHWFFKCEPVLVSLTKIYQKFFVAWWTLKLHVIYEPSFVERGFMHYRLCCPRLDGAVCTG